MVRSVVMQSCLQPYFRASKMLALWVPNFLERSSQIYWQYSSNSQDRRCCTYPWWYTSCYMEDESWGSLDNWRRKVSSSSNITYCYQVGQSASCKLRKILTLLIPLHQLVMRVPDHKGHQHIELLWRLKSEVESLLPPLPPPPPHPEDIVTLGQCDLWIFKIM